MEFGKLPSVDNLDLRLPADAGSPWLRQRPPPRDPATLRIGTAGWSDPGFVGKLYPPRTPKGQFLKHYAQAFRTNELNSTYYGFDADRIAAWAALAPPGFRFCPKIPGAVSHERQFEQVDGIMGAFLDAVEAFGERRGTIWTILPPTFGPDRIRILERFLRRCRRPGGAPLAVEFRHPDWFREPGATAGFGLLEQLGVTAIITDVAGRRDVLHQRLTTDRAFVRFVGNGGHASDSTRLQEWCARIADWVAAGLQELDFFLHQPQDHLTVETAERFVPALNEALPEDLSIPCVERLTTPRQNELF